MKTQEEKNQPAFMLFYITTTWRKCTRTLARVAVVVSCIPTAIGAGHGP